MNESSDRTIVAVRRGRPLTATGDPMRLRLLDARAVPPNATLVPLADAGRAGRSLLVLDAGISDDAAFAALGLEPDEARFADVTTQLARFEGTERSELLRAVALAQWSDEARFCSICGAPLSWEPGSRTKVCADSQRPHRHFPRTDPATIMLVTDGERALLGRQKSWPPGMFSTLAGFVEPGETAEDGVAREVLEETGIRVSDVRYVASESWPFPRSLMLAFTARARTTEIVVDTSELEEARWFDRDEVAALQGAMRERLPHFDTIARRLLAGWLDARAQPG